MSWWRALCLDDVPLTQTVGTDPTTVLVPEGGVVTDEDGFAPEGAGLVSGTVFLDSDLDGIPDEGEGLPDVEVVVTDSNNDTYTVTTDSDGKYSLEVPDGEATIVVVESTLPDDVPLTQTVGTDPTTVLVPEGGVATDEDGFAPEGAGLVSGTVFLDSDLDGIPDEGEGLPDVEVVVTDSNNDTYTVTTDSDGKYSLEVPDGEATIVVVESTLPDDVPLTQTVGTDPTTVLVPEGGVVTDEDGFAPEGAGLVSGTVFLDSDLDGIPDEGEGLPDVEVVVTDSNNDTYTVTTDSDGKYSLEVPDGEATIVVVESTLPRDVPLTQTVGTDPTTVLVPEGGVVTDEDGFAPEGAGLVSGTVFLDSDLDGIPDEGEGLPDVEVVVTDSNNDTYTVTTDSDGKYSLEVPDGEATIVVVESTLPDDVPLTQTVGTDPTTVLVPEGGVVTDEDGFAPEGAGLVSGTVFLDSDLDGIPDEGEGLPDVEVVVTDSNNDTYTVTTDSDGKYSQEVPVGEATIVVVESTLPQDVPLTQTVGTDPTTVLVPEGGVVTDEDGFAPEGTGLVSGTVFLDSDLDGIPDEGEGLPDVEVVVTDSNNDTYTVTTDSDGKYSQEVPVGEATIVVVESTLPQDVPLTQTVGTDPTTVLVPEGGVVTDEDGFAPEGTGLVAGTVFLDSDLDGIPDEGEGLPDVEVVVTDSNNDTYTVTTDSDGKYSQEVPVGEATIVVVESTLPQDVPLTQTVGTDPTTVLVPEGGVVTDEDGFAPEGTGLVAGTVFLDSDLDGIPDEGEGLPDVEVVVTDSNNDTYTVTTDSDGKYSQEVPVGEATIVVVESTLPQDVPLTQTVGTDPTTVLVPEGGVVTDEDGFAPEGTGLVSGTVFLDSDLDGIPDEGEGLPDVEVVVTDSNNDTYTVTTDSDGKYSQEVPVGEATIVVVESTLPRRRATDTDGWYRPDDCSSTRGRRGHRRRWLCTRRHRPSVGNCVLGLGLGRHSGRGRRSSGRRSGGH